MDREETMRSLSESVRLMPILFLALTPLTATAWGTQKQSAEVDLVDRHYVAGKGTADIPADISPDEQNRPQMAVRSGDAIVLRNKDKVYWRPLSLTPGNRFTTPAKGLAPGQSKTIIARNTTGKPILLKLHDEIHPNSKIVIAVLPGEDEDTGGNTFAGKWKTTWGPATFTLGSDGKTVTGTYTYSLSRGGTAQGKLSGTITGNQLIGNWSEAYRDLKAAGTMTLTLADDGASFAGPWKKVSGKAAADSGEWKGTRQKK